LFSIRNLSKRFETAKSTLAIMANSIHNIDSSMPSLYGRGACLSNKAATAWRTDIDLAGYMCTPSHLCSIYTLYIDFYVIYQYKHSPWMN
ncbi:MAG: hypothetical protein M1332_00930, partial [Deltaproteobacteria bacterium]|nr:hypothetical protein [Deltaproteobacteria bacterium]